MKYDAFVSTVLSKKSTIVPITKSLLVELVAKVEDLDGREKGCSDCFYGLTSNVYYCPWCGKRLRKSEVE